MVRLAQLEAEVADHRARLGQALVAAESPASPATPISPDLLASPPTARTPRGSCSIYCGDRPGASFRPFPPSPTLRALWISALVLTGARRG